MMFDDGSWLFSGRQKSYRSRFEFQNLRSANGIEQSPDEGIAARDEGI